MKIKLEILMNSGEALKALSELDSLESVVAFRVARLLSDMQEIYTSFDTAKKKLVTRLGDAQDDGSFFIPNPSKEEYTSEIQKLLEEEIDINIPIMKESDFAKSSFKPAHILSLLWLIKE